jgi:rhodanese-related sulfurtransferase
MFTLSVLLNIKLEGTDPMFIEPEQFNQKLQKGDISVNQVIDVREIAEWNYYHLEQTIHIPMNSIPEKMNMLNQEETLYLICAHGVRSAMVCDYLSKHNFAKVINVEGGMAAIAELRGFQYD